MPLVETFLHEDVLAAFPADRLQPYFGALLNSPLISAGIGKLAAVYRSRGEFPDGMSHADREWVGLVLCEELGDYWVAYVHTPDAIATGVRPEAILAIFEGQRDGLTPEEREKDEFICSVADGTMTAERYESMEALVGVRGAVEMTCFSSFMIHVIRLRQAFGVPDTTRAHLIEWLHAFVDGTVAVPDPRPRIQDPAVAAAGVSS